MVVLADDSVIKKTGLPAPTGVHSTITVEELKELILNSPVVQSYQGAAVEHLTPGGAWFTNNVLTISITIEGNPAP